MKIWLPIFLVFGFYFTYAQNPDSSLLKTNNNKAIKINLSERLNQIHENSRKIKSLILPTFAIAYGFISLENEGLITLNNNTKIEIKEDNPGPVTKLDNYLQFSPAIAVYGLNAFGIKGKNNFRDRSIIYLLSNIIVNTSVFSIKKITYQLRPDSSAYTSFPSGHTAEAFASAEFMWQEYKDVSPWYGIAGYGVAAATAILRLYNNKHWVSDIVAGAGFGILSTKLAYWIYPVIKRKFFKNKPMNTMVMPFYQNGGGGISMIYNFRQ